MASLFQHLVFLLPAEALAKVQAEHGGEWHYIPKGARSARVVRDEEMRSRFNGSNLAELARAYELSERQVRRICCPSKVTPRDLTVSNPAA